MPTQTWIAALGSIRFEDNELRYTPSPITPTADAPDAPSAPPQVVAPRIQQHTAWAKSNMTFEDGAVTFDVWFESQDSICQLVLNSDTRQPWLLVGFNTSGFPYGIQTLSAGNFRVLSSAGTSPDFALNTWVPVQISVIGSTVSLSVQGVPLCSANFEVLPSALSFLLQGSGTIKIRNINVDEARPKAFIVMQFGTHFDELYQEVIRPSCEQFGYEVIRADEMFNNGPILADIIASIKDASIVIADITPDNPNVYYELGFAHALSKPTILLCDRKRERLPFDVSSVRTIFYENSIGGKSDVEQRLRKHLQQIRRPMPGFQIQGGLSQR